MRIIISGGTGLIGRAFAGSMVNSGHEIVIFSRNPGDSRELPGRVHVEPWDGTSVGPWARWIDGADAVVNLAGASIAGSGLLDILFGRWTQERKQAILDSRTRAGQALVSAIGSASAKPAMFLQMSAVGYYGMENNEALGENAPPGSDFLANVCIAWEESTSHVESMGIRRVVMRPGVVLSRKGGILPMILLPFRFFIGGPLGNGQQAFPWIHIADQISAMRFLIEDPQARGVFNLTAPQSLTNAEFERIVGDVMRRPAVFPTPGFALRMVLGEKASLILRGQRAEPRRLLAAGFRFAFPDAETALRDLFQRASPAPQG